jgi:hypothetical protein
MRVPVVTVALCLAPALALPQSLGDAARRQAKKRTEQAPTPAKSYTDADLHTGATESAALTPAGTSPGTATAQSAAAPAVPPVASARPSESEDAVRAQLDREAEQRRQRERWWKQAALDKIARLERARQEYDAACGAGALIAAGG